jgi:hypothetical protein
MLGVLGDFPSKSSFHSIFLKQHFFRSPLKQQTAAHAGAVGPELGVEKPGRTLRFVLRSGIPNTAVVVAIPRRNTRSSDWTQENSAPASLTLPLFLL